MAKLAAKSETVAKLNALLASPTEDGRPPFSDDEIVEILAFMSEGEVASLPGPPPTNRKK